MIKKFFYAAMACGLLAFVMSCEDQKFNNINVDVDRVELDHLTEDMIKVRDYVPEYAVVAHRGSTFWAPEETEAAYRWAREIGADYLECDMQVSKDGVVLALHDDNLKRTTNIENVFGETLPFDIRKAYYQKIGYTEAEADSLTRVDAKNFVPNLPAYYTYEELSMLDAGTWFNETSIEQARPSFSEQHQYVSTLEDLVNFARGKILKRDGDGQRVFTIGQKTGEKIKSLSGTADLIKYTFEYEADPEDTGHRPGIYIEFKEPWLNPTGFEELVYEELDRLDMNIITKPEAENTPFYVNGKVNTGNTNGKVILQTFSLESLVRIAEHYKG